MPESAAVPSRAYVMTHTDTERRRLALQASIINPFTDRFLRDAGIAGGMHVDAYLPTRVFELAVHSLDIAAAIDVPPSLPAAVLGDALHLAAEIALLRGDGERLLLSLTGRRALPDGYSVV